MISENFINTIKNANFEVLKCYKNALDLSSIWTNIGRICMLIILLLSIILMIYFYFKDSKNIDKILQSFLNKNFNSCKANLYNLENGKDKTETKRKGTKKKKSNILKIKSETIKNKENNNIKKEENKFAPPKHNNNFEIIGTNISKNKECNSKSKIVLNEEKDNSIKKRVTNKVNTINIRKNKNINIGNIYKNKKLSENENDNLILSKHKFGVKRRKLKTNQTIKSSSNTHNNLKNIESKKNEKTLNYNNLNDYELNSLEYKDALIIDKRTFSQYYWSLLKRKHLILFTFCPAKDYNLLSIKLYLFLMSISLSFTITGFFFDNKTMHNIFIDNGEYNFIYEFPKILLCSLITTVINLLLKQLSLSEKSFISIKNEKYLNLMEIKSKKMKKYLKIKFAGFFILSNLFLIFFLYFISCFCSIYPNTQIILIIDTILSFCFSMIYPFGLYLLPTIFRILALRASKKDKVCLYKFGYIISLL